MNIRNTRWVCPHCKTEGWDSAGRKVSGRFDHDRADGRVCRKARADLEVGKAGLPATVTTPGRARTTAGALAPVEERGGGS